jgi:hypothetical protein
VSDETKKEASQSSPQEVILGLALSYLPARGLHVANELGVADLLKDGPRSIEELARATGVHQKSLYRLLRMLAGFGVFAEGSPGRFQLTASAAALQSGVAESLHDAVKMIGDMTGEGSWWNAAGLLAHCVRTGEPAFDQVNSAPFFDHLSQHPEASRWFDRGLANFAAAENAAIVEAYDFGSFRKIVDVGGGQGGFLGEVLKGYPSLRGTLYDRREVVEEPAYLTAAGLTGRWDVVAGDFFKSLPAGADAYVLKRILHDWNDEMCLKILRKCRGSMNASARILVVDAVVPPGNEPHPSKIMDILMMLLFEGRERTEQEFRILFDQTGLTLTRVIPTRSVLSVIEGKWAEHL